MSQASEAYREAYASGLLQMGEGGPGVLDLHGFPVEVARLAVEAAVQDLLAGRRPVPAGAAPPALPRMVFITGRGRRSTDEALLRPMVLRVLREDFGLEGRVQPANPGRVVIRATQVRAFDDRAEALLRGTPTSPHCALSSHALTCALLRS